MLPLLPLTQAGNTRRPASRTRTNDENALPTQAMRAKTSMSHLGPAQKVVGPAKKIVAVKAGAKRTALGGVVGNSQKEDMEDTRKSCEVATLSIGACTDQPSENQQQAGRGSTATRFPYQQCPSPPNRPRPPSCQIRLVPTQH